MIGISLRIAEISIIILCASKVKGSKAIKSELLRARIRVKFDFQCHLV